MDVINSLKHKIIDIEPKNFDALALEIFKFQTVNNSVYYDYIKSLGKNPEHILKVSDIPYLPISFFKSHKVSINNINSPIIFSSSGTTGVTKSNHHLPDADWYKEISRKGFQSIYGNLKDFCILALLPSYRENPSSSLIFMIDHFIRCSGSTFSGYVSTPDQILKIRESLSEGTKVLLIGVSYALLDLADTGIDLAGWIIMETGGMKGRKKEIIRDELHSSLKKGLNVSEIHSEYGMTELLSQAYSLSGGILKTPEWVKISTREINDPFSENAGRTGILKIIDLANIYSCAFLETEDLGIVHQNGSFEVLGRMDNSEMRGCNLLYTG